MRLAERFDLPGDIQIGLLSGGEQRKVSLLLAVAARPEVLLLDEPAAGLDPIARRELIEVLVDALAEQSLTVMFSTHILADLERLADHVGMMDRGRMVSSQRLDVIQSQTKRVQVIFPNTAPPPDFRIPGTLRARTEGPVVTAVVRLEDEAQLAPVQAMADVRVNVYPLGLEDVFVEMFGPEPLDEPAAPVEEIR
jgi:ABC-2 type transport system ATP-binding protein